MKDIKYLWKYRVKVEIRAFEDIVTMNQQPLAHRIGEVEFSVAVGRHRLRALPTDHAGIVV